MLLAMIKPQESILQLLNAMSDRLALEDGFFQCATSWRQLPLVPQILSEDLSDIQDLPEVAWMYDTGWCFQRVFACFEHPLLMPFVVDRVGPFQYR